MAVSKALAEYVEYSDKRGADGVAYAMLIAERNGADIAVAAQQLGVGDNHPAWRHVNDYHRSQAPKNDK